MGNSLNGYMKSAQAMLSKVSDLWAWPPAAKWFRIM